MKAMPEQNYSNHVRRVPSYLAIGALLFLTIIGACVNLYKSWGDHERLYSAALILALSVATLGVGLFARTFPLKAQDRAIRAEENLRHYVLTGKLLDARLRPGQIAALRFASDEEFADLAARAASGDMKPDDIKQAIKNWRADEHRV